MLPRFLARGEEETVDGALQRHDDGDGDGECEVRVADVFVAVHETVRREWHGPHEDVGEWVEEEEFDLALCVVAAFAELVRVEVCVAVEEVGQAEGSALPGGALVDGRGREAVAHVEEGGTLEAEGLQEVEDALGLVRGWRFGGSGVGGGGFASFF